MKVEVLYFDGCPNHDATVELVNQVLKEEGVTAAEVLAVPVPDEETARSIGFLGSPSIRVNGLDVEAAARSARDYGMACRTYVVNGHRSGLPSREMLRQAVLEVTGTNDRPLSVTAETGTSPPKPDDPGSGRLSLLMTGTMIAAIGASLCCTLPIVFALTGLSILGASAFFESLRPYFLAVTFGLLGLGFYYAYRPVPQEACAPSSACAVPSKRRGARIALWAISALALAFAAFPYYSGPVAELLLTGSF